MRSYKVGYETASTSTASILIIRKVDFQLKVRKASIQHHKYGISEAVNYASKLEGKYKDEH